MLRRGLRIRDRLALYRLPGTLVQFAVLAGDQDRAANRLKVQKWSDESGDGGWLVRRTEICDN